MFHRLLTPFAAVTVAVAVAVATPAASLPRIPRPDPPPDGAVTFSGAGNAHGMGLAMDGVLGQARAGWPYTKILDLFYPGTTFTQASGPIRVGLAQAASHELGLPGGGTVQADGTTTEIPPHTTIRISFADGRYVVDAPGLVRAAQDEPPVPIRSPEPSAEPPAPQPDATPSPEATPSPTPSPSDAPTSSSDPVRVVPHGSPAITQVAATGRRYRGEIEIRRVGEALWAINHVDLETYVQGIAEEKGAGWPVEGLKVLAVAARSLAVATRTWYDRHHPNGFDICPTGMCQVYLGYDGEESSMTQATRETAGQILTHDGRAILAMYHGNGGGQTDSYKLIYGNGVTDAHPYLRAVEYPYAKPLRWSRSFSPEQATEALRAKGVAVPGRFEGIEILSTGHSPRVREVRIVGSDGSVETTGHTFRSALDLPSIWFEMPPPDETTPTVTAAPIERSVAAGVEIAQPEVAGVAAASSTATGRDDTVPIGALATLLLALAVGAAVEPSLRDRLRR